MSEAIARGTLVDHTVWGRGKVVDVGSLHVVVHFPSLAGSEQGPRRKLRLTAEQLPVSAVQSDPALEDPHRSGQGRGTEAGADGSHSRLTVGAAARLRGVGFGRSTPASSRIRSLCPRSWTTSASSRQIPGAARSGAGQGAAGGRCAPGDRFQPGSSIKLPTSRLRSRRWRRTTASRTGRRPVGS